jgi:hypothetical protein
MQNGSTSLKKKALSSETLSCLIENLSCTGSSIERPPTIISYALNQHLTYPSNTDHFVNFSTSPANIVRLPVAQYGEVAVEGLSKGSNL